MAIYNLQAGVSYWWKWGENMGFFKDQLSGFFFFCLLNLGLLSSIEKKYPEYEYKILRVQYDYYYKKYILEYYFQINYDFFSTMHNILLYNEIKTISLKRRILKNFFFFKSHHTTCIVSFSPHHKHSRGRNC